MGEPSISPSASTIISICWQALLGALSWTLTRHAVLTYCQGDVVRRKERTGSARTN